MGSNEWLKGAQTMYDYVTTKPELEEVLYHAGFHKYIDRYMGKNGKWVYVYNKAKKNIADAAYKTKNAIRGMHVRNERRKLGFKAEDVSLVRQHMVKNGRRYLIGLGYRGDDGRARSTGSSSGNKGYTGSIGSLLQSRYRAQLSRAKREHEQKVAKQVEKQGYYRPTSRKKKVGEGTGSVKINGTKGLGLNVKANLLGHRVRARRTENAIKERERNRKAAIRAKNNRKYK